MVRPADERDAYRCSVAPENSAAKLKIGHKFYDINVVDTSRNGFTVRVSNRTFGKLREGSKYVLRHAGETWLVSKQSHYNETDKSTQVGFARLQDLTPVEKPKTSLLQVFSSKAHGSSDPAFLLYLMLAFLFACVALPGMGDNLGTAPRIRDGIREIMTIIQDFMG